MKQKEYSVYKYIKAKVEEWIWYDEHQPKSNYFANREEHDTYRSQHDRDCARAQRPYCDYVPVFLLESFPGGAFADH